MTWRAQSLTNWQFKVHQQFKTVWIAACMLGGATAGVPCVYLCSFQDLRQVAALRQIPGLQYVGLSALPAMLCQRQVHGAFSLAYYVVPDPGSAGVFCHHCRHGSFLCRCYHWHAPQTGLGPERECGPRPKPEDPVRGTVNLRPSCTIMWLQLA
eukprot:1160947-Pelagomonas_calceolata.AAC.2